MKLKKIVAFLLSAVLLLPAFTMSVGAASYSVFKVDVSFSAAESYAPGDVVSVTVKAVQNTGFDFLKLKISYNADALEYVDFVNHAVFGKSNTETFLPKAGYVLYTALTNNVATQTGNMFTLNFKIKEGFCGDVDVAAQLSADNPNNCMITDPKLKEVVPFVGDTASFVMEHKYESQVTAPDCVNGGYTTYTCSVCGHTYDDNAVDALGHTYDNDCDATCNVCEAVREVADHVYDNDCDANCNSCDAAREVPDHVYDNACDADCNVCGTTREVADHLYESKVTDPDCVNGGYTTYTCSVCGHTYDDNAVDALGHTYDNDCDATCNVCEAVREVADHVYDNDCDTDCNACGAVREVPDHLYESQVTAPDCVNGGYTTYTCSVCGDSYVSDETAALGHVYDNDCDATCNVCEAVREVADHVYDDDYDADCNVCGAVREVAEKPVDTVYGDLNGDGEINNRDLVLLQQYLNNWDVTIDTAAGDCNNDGEINNRDLVLLQQYLNNWDVTLG